MHIIVLSRLVTRTSTFDVADRSAIHRALASAADLAHEVSRTLDESDFSDEEVTQVITSDSVSGVRLRDPEDEPTRVDHLRDVLWLAPAIGQDECVLSLCRKKSDIAAA